MYLDLKLAYNNEKELDDAIKKLMKENRGYFKSDRSSRIHAIADLWEKNVYDEMKSSKGVALLEGKELDKY